MISIFWDFHVKALETVSVPAGTFKAFRIEGTSFRSDGGYQTTTYWIDPEQMVKVKQEAMSRGRYQEVYRSYLRELVSVRRGG